MPPGIGRGEVQGRAHRGRVGVVGVVDDGETVQLHQTAPPRRQRHGGEALGGRDRVRPRLLGDREGDHRVLHLMQPDHRQGQRAPPPANHRPPGIIQLGRLRAHLGGRVASGDDGARALARFRRELGRIGPHDGHRHPFDERQLLAHHAGERAEPLDVRVPDVGDHGDGRLDDGAELRDLARHAGARLDHERPRVARRAEDGERHADEVVEVAGRGVDVPARREHRANHLLGAGLAAGAGDRDDRRAGRQRPAARAGEKPQRREGVVDFKKRQPGLLRRPAPHDGRRRAASLRVLQKVVGVETVALQGNKQGVGCQVSGVGGHRLERQPCWCLHSERCGDCLRSPLHSAPNSRTISRSSKCCFSVPMI